MSDVGFLNLTNLILSTIAWLIPVVCLVLPSKEKNKIWGVLSFTSITACVATLFFQTCYQKHLVDIWEWSAEVDRTDTFMFATSTLLVVTLALNILVFLAYRLKFTQK